MDEVRRHDSQDRLSAFDEDAALLNWSFNELLEIYSSADVPNRQPNFHTLHRELARKAPQYKGDELRIYRGTSFETLAAHGVGHVWTTDLKVAEKFAEQCCSGRYAFIFGCIDQHPVVLSAVVSPDNVIIHHENDRNEDEVLIKDPAPLGTFLKIEKCWHTDEDFIGEEPRP